MFKIKELIEERTQWNLSSDTRPRRDELLELLPCLIADTPDGEVAFITLFSSLSNERNLKDIQKECDIVGVYEIGKIFINVGCTFYIVQLSKKTPAKKAPHGLKIALFKGKCYDERQRYNKGHQHDISDPHTPVAPDSYTEEWESYISQLESWMNGGDIPKSNELFEFYFVRKNNLYKGSYIPETYSRENIELRKHIAEQDTRALSELADILFPHPDSKNDKEVKVLRAGDFKYPLDVSKIGLSKPTNVILQKGDVLVPRIKSGKAKPYLFNYDGKERIYASYHHLVIRCRKIIPEYLYWYLNTDIALKVLNASYAGEVFQTIRGKDIVDLPIAVPIYDNQKYILAFNTLANPGVRDYGQLQRLNDYCEQIDKNKEKPRIVEDLIDIELANTIRAYNEDQLRTFLTNDMRELNACYKAKAYKATLILAGSILEAFLIDWLSEYDGIDYFDEKVKYCPRKNYGRNPDLSVYINEIEYLYHPSWMKWNGCYQSHTIRENRNLVHAKLCMKPDVKIDKDTCKMVTGYLKYVLNTRSNLQKKGRVAKGEGKADNDILLQRGQ